MKKITAGIIIIGNEILSGRTHDKNSNFIAKHLIKSGIQLSEIKIIPDNKKIIIDTVKDYRKKFNYVFTTGGIGPTHDDITTESIAKAFKKKVILNKEAYKILKNHYSNKRLNTGRKKMAMLPEGCKLILNPLTSAPGFIIKNIYVLPGVPSIMEVMFKSILIDLKKGKKTVSITLKTDLFESKIAKKLSNIQKKFPDFDIGSYPYFNFVKKIGGVNIVISSWQKDDLSKIIKEIKKMISLLGGKSLIL
ncbi:MAG: CinA-like protein [Alphaproteobacteria bacterium MarineAlpha5_Bin9]|nr:MAG: CinA-like protein [Alphaproteobacteria bacterium MarineAlpha5_Bin9]|tara:strand:+ start:22134 stop:22880 length:747 start_codon:yes stop_codon:yes gene_type:complete